MAGEFNLAKLSQESVGTAACQLGVWHSPQVNHPGIGEPDKERTVGAGGTVVERGCRNKAETRSSQRKPRPAKAL